MKLAHWSRLSLVFCLIPLAQAYTVFETNCSAPTTLSNYVSSPNTRGTLDILWSSLFTIFACTWALQHPNVPAQRDESHSEQSKHVRWMSAQWRSAQWRDAKWGLKSLYRSTLRMLCTIIAPELIMMAACANWLEARENHRKMQKYAEQDGVAWSLSHSYFANMGGFIVRGKPTKSQRHHDPYHLNGTCVYLLRKRGYITRLPNMTEAEIKDKSKGDMLAKLVALGQIVWSTVQIIARAVRRLPVSPLEVAVVAFAVSAVFIYGLYWNKPQRVGVAQTIQLTIANMPNEGAKSDRATSDESAEPIDVVTSEAVTVDEGLISEEGTLPAEVYHLLESNGTDRAFKQMAIEMFGIESKALPGAPISVDSADMVGMFSLTAGVVGFGAAVFGAIHAVAWNFAFPSRVELILWRCASIYTAAAPLCTLLLGYVGDTLDFNNSFEEALGETIGNLLLGLCLLFMIVLPTILYILARLFIVVEMFRTLCFLPPESYVSTWTSNIPHIG